MTWETIPLRGSGVTVSWRVPGGKGSGLQLALTISSGVCSAAGFAPGCRVAVQRDRMAGRLRLLLADDTMDGARRMIWKPTKSAVCAQMFVPMKDVQQALQQRKPAQTCHYDVEPGTLTIRLPPWACPLVQVSGGATPIPLRSGKAA